jgi:hypothetical protein
MSVIDMYITVLAVAGLERRMSGIRELVARRRQPSVRRRGVFLGEILQPFAKAICGGNETRAVEDLTQVLDKEGVSPSFTGSSGSSTTW